MNEINDLHARINDMENAIVGLVTIVESLCKTREEQKILNKESVKLALIQTDDIISLKKVVTGRSLISQGKN